VAETHPKIALVKPAHAIEVLQQRGLDRDRQHRHSILVPLAFTDENLISREVDVLHA
jgi:hypothetical protein